jgi:transposase
MAVWRAHDGGTRCGGLPPGKKEGCNMFLRKNFSKKTGRTYLAIVQGYRDDKGVTRHRTVQKVGYLDELTAQYEDPVAHFAAVAASMEADRKASKFLTLTIDTDSQLERGTVRRKNYGHVVFSKIYHELEIDRFLNNARRHENFKFNTDSIMRLAVFSRLLSPCSKRATVLEKGRYFDAFRFTLDDVYNALTHFDAISNALQRHLHEMVSHLYGRDMSLVYYDVTNYYFEIDREDACRKKGPSKEHRKDPIVQMGLVLDRTGFPVAYKMFPGNTHDSQTLMPSLADVKKDFGAARIVVVADKGLNSGDNIAYNLALGDGYVYSKSVRGASDEFKMWVLDEAGYRTDADGCKRKSRVIPDAPNYVTLETSPSTGKRFKRPRKVNMPIEQKQVVFFSQKYADRARHKREEAVRKALKLIANPSKYRRSLDYGAIGYIQNIEVDKETGEIKNIHAKLILDTEKIQEEEKFDGYYAIVTSELEDSDASIIDAYKGLWRIEESFKVTKSVLEARPIFLRTFAHINAHFLICFLSLLIGRIVERRLGGRYTIENIVETLRKVECSHVEQNIWLFDFADEVTDAMNEAFGTNFGRKYMSLGEIKKFLGSVKS